MNDKTFWALVKEQNWPATAKNTDYEKARFFTNHTVEVCGEYRKTIREKYLNLHDAMVSWERNSHRHVPCGDDGYSDLLNHIIGLGQKIYEASLKNPTLIFNRAEKGMYVESFYYVVPGEYDLVDLNPQKYVDWAAKTYYEIVHGKKMDTGKIRNPYKRLKNQYAVDQAIQVCTEVAAGNFELKGWNVESAHRLANNLGQWTVPNLILDVMTYREFFTKNDIAAITFHAFFRESPTAKRFDREKAVKMLNEKLLHKLLASENRDIVAKKIVEEGFVPYAKRSWEELQKLLDKQSK